MIVVAKEEFKKRTNTNYSYSSSAEAYETNQSFECGCGEDHFIGKDGVKVIKQVDHFEFVVSCANGFDTLIENDLNLRQQFSIISTKVSI
tara:strand:- start:116 stop:385 length:270 start_codon:yes stop_codon:yes gene_type:complete